ncbi:MAG: hypothetical protein WDN72_03755 [Alphaproteobacteria bacterium]
MKPAFTKSTSLSTWKAWRVRVIAHHARQADRRHFERAGQQPVLLPAQVQAGAEEHACRQAELEKRPVDDGNARLQVKLGLRQAVDRQLDQQEYLRQQQEAEHAGHQRRQRAQRAYVEAGIDPAQSEHLRRERDGEELAFQLDRQAKRDEYRPHDDEDGQQPLPFRLRPVELLQGLAGEVQRQQGEGDGERAPCGRAPRIVQRVVGDEVMAGAGGREQPGPRHGPVGAP